MPKVTGPLFSVTASGTYKKLLVFRTGQGRTTVSPPSSTNKPRSDAQIAHSENIATMAACWSDMPEEQRAPWRARAATEATNGRALFWREWITQGADAANPPVIPS